MKVKSNKSDPSSTGHPSEASELAAPFKLRQILVPTDFSEPAEKALRYSNAIAKQFGAKITLLHVIQLAIVAEEFGYVTIDDRDWVKAAQDRLRSLGSRTMPGDQLADTIVERGVPFDVITATAESIKADLIVISTHGYTGLKHVLMGSTAERVVRYARCPVLVLRAQENAAAGAA